MDEKPLGFDVPIHRSLTEPILLGGAPRQLSILNATFTGALAIGMQNFLAIPLGIIIHMLAVWGCKSDPLFFEVLLRHLKEKEGYYL